MSDIYRHPDDDEKLRRKRENRTLMFQFWWRVALIAVCATVGYFMAGEALVGACAGILAIFFVEYICRRMSLFSL